MEALSIGDNRRMNSRLKGFQPTVRLRGREYFVRVGGQSALSMPKGSLETVS